MRIIITIFGLILTFLTYGQEKSDTIKIIAKLVLPGVGSRIQIAEYKLIKTINGTVTNDTIKVGYYFYNEYENSPDTALLTLISYTGNTKIKDYYIFPDYNAKKGIEKVKISEVEFEYWEACETGKGECKPLNFTRKSKNKKWFLLMPCGGTETTVTLSKRQGMPKENEIIQKCQITHSGCPPVFDLTNLEDGKYFAYMLSCGLGGQIEINIKTESE